MRAHCAPRQRARVVAVDILVGTDVQLLAATPDGRLRYPRYTPNLQVEARDALMGGDIRVHTQQQELSYTKNFDVNGARARDQPALAPLALGCR
jgi:hypothetical protein